MQVTGLFDDYENGPHSHTPLADTRARKREKRWSGEGDVWIGFERGCHVAARQMPNGRWFAQCGDGGNETYLAPKRDAFATREEAIEYARGVIRGEHRHPLHAEKVVRPRNTFGSPMDDAQYADWLAAREGLSAQIAAE